MFENIETVIFDLDGTIYYGNEIINGVEEVLEYLNKNNKNIFYLTNNSTKTRKQIQQRLINMGLDCKLEQVYTSGYLSGIYIKNKNLNNVFVLGSEDLKKELREMNIELTENEDLAECILIGYDVNFNYENMTKALNIALKGKKIFACNKEKHYPGKNARRLPGCGAMVGAIEMCSGRKVDYVIGKPNSMMLEILAEENNLDKNSMVMVGDTYESDIAMANEYGCKSILISNDSYKNTISIKNIIQILKLENIRVV